MNGPGYDYFPQPSKSTPVVKPEKEVQAQCLFAGTKVSITANGARYLGAPLGTAENNEQSTRELVSQWVHDVKQCSHMASTQPQAANYTFVNALQHRWAYVERVTDISSHLLTPLNQAFDAHIVPAITGQTHITTDPVRQLHSLPVRNGGLNTPKPSASAAAVRAASLEIKVKLLLSPQFQPSTLNARGKPSSGIRSREYLHGPGSLSLHPKTIFELPSVSTIREPVLLVRNGASMQLKRHRPVQRISPIPSVG